MDGVRGKKGSMLMRVTLSYYQSSQFFTSINHTAFDSEYSSDGGGCLDCRGE